MFKKLKEKLEEENKSSSANPFGSSTSSPNTSSTSASRTSSVSIVTTPRVSNSTTSIVNPNYVITSPSLIAPPSPEPNPISSGSSTNPSVYGTPTFNSSKDDISNYGSDLLVDLTPNPSVVPNSVVIGTPSLIETLTEIVETSKSVATLTPTKTLKPVETQTLILSTSDKESEANIKNDLSSKVVTADNTFSITDKDQLIAKHKKEMDQLSARVQDLMKTNLSLIKDKEHLIQRSNQDQIIIKKLNDQINMLNGEKSALDAKIKSLSSIETRMKTLTDDINKKIADNDGIIKDRDAKITDLDNAIKHLQSEMEMKDNENVKLNHKLMEQSSEYEDKIKTLDDEISVLKTEIKLKIDGTIPRTEHESALAKLEEIIADKNKTLKLQQQRISDLKKSIQKGDFPSSPAKEVNSDVGGKNDVNRVSTPDGATSNGDNHHRHNLVTGSSSNHTENCCHSKSSVCLDINFEYLKNVVFKFITASDVESQKQLIKAIATILQFNRDQEAEIREFINWKTSWLSVVPVIGPNLAPHPHDHGSINSSSISKK